MRPHRLRDIVSASRFVKGAIRLESETEEKVSDYENFVSRKSCAARSHSPESSRRTSRVTISNGSSGNDRASRVSSTKVREQFRYGTEIHSRHSTPVTLSPVYSLGHRSHLSHRTSNWSGAESRSLFSTPLSPDHSSARSQQISVHRHSTRRYQPRVVSPESRQTQRSSFATESPPLRQIHTIPSAAAPQLRVSSAKVYIAASRKGKCYHSHEACSGLRSAHGVTSLSLKDASNMLGMRPCKVCRPQSMPSERPEQFLEPMASQSFSYSLEASPRSSSLSTAPTYWITSNGQCYHSSRSCSSLRRSKVVTSSYGKPAGRRPCRLCC